MMKPFTSRVRKEWKKMFQEKDEKIVNEKISSEEASENQLPPEDFDEARHTISVTPEMLQKMAEGMERAKEAEARSMRLQADFDNFRKRNQREREELSNYASQKIVTALLPILDDFDRAIESGGDITGVEENYLAGVEMIHRRLWDVLQKEGLEEIETLHKPFDPNFHEAVSTCPAPEGVEENTITMVLRKGYKMKEKVIRASMVQVAHK